MKDFDYYMPKAKGSIRDQEYHDEVNRLKKEFWDDARRELGYDLFLTEKGCKILEDKAWEDGHYAGFGNVFACLDDLADFAHKLVVEGKK